jgi:hypothetical protein
MSQVNPLTGSIVQATQVQRAQSTDREQQVRRQQVRTKDTAAHGDQFEHTVESSDSVAAIHEQDHSNDQNSKRKHHQASDEPDPHEEDQPSLDVTA